MKNKDRIYNLIEVLIAAEKHKDNQEKIKNSKLAGESATLFHLKRLKEMIQEEFGA